jgi:hypothetical protein
MMVLFFVVAVVLDPPLWAVGFLFLANMTIVILVHGLFERSIRHAAWRRFRSRSKQAELTEGSSAPNHEVGS